MAGKNLAMKGQRMSVACISEPEFLNITSINPLISKAEVKVLYVGENRNKSYISKEVATKMAGTLPGCPIVGYYREDKEDFFDHGNVVTIDGDGVKFHDATRPYGFVAPNAKIWFQKFMDTDEDGNEVLREYLMTEAFLWTGQYEECQRVVEDESGNPQSMKLHEETLDGTWSKLGMSNIDFFIINDAIIQNLCILGEDIEPCFEGADVTKPKLSANFSHNDENVTTLFSMMKELKDLLSQEGGHSMLDETKVEFEAVVTEDAPVVEEKIENFSNEQDKIDEVTPVENQINTEEFKKQDEEEKEEKPSDEKKEDDSAKDSKSEDSTSDNEDKKDEDEDKKKKEFELLETEYAELKERFASLEASYNELVEFKKNVEDKQKDELIASFYMLDEEDKKAVIEKKSEYSLDDIEKELSVICVRKKVNFNLEEEIEKSEQGPATTFNLDSLEVADAGLPAWLKAVQETSKSH